MKLGERGGLKHQGGRVRADPTDVELQAWADEALRRFRAALDAIEVDEDDEAAWDTLEGYGCGLHRNRAFVRLAPLDRPYQFSLECSLIESAPDRLSLVDDYAFIYVCGDRRIEIPLQGEHAKTAQAVLWKQIQWFCED
jgi:hypothetical protein